MHVLTTAPSSPHRQSLGADCGTRATSLLRALAGAEDFARCEQAAQFDVTEVEQQWWATAAHRKEEAVQPSMQVLTTALPDPLPTGG